MSSRSSSKNNASKLKRQTMLYLNYYYSKIYGREASIYVSYCKIHDSDTSLCLTLYIPDFEKNMFHILLHNSGNFAPISIDSMDCALPAISKFIKTFNAEHFFPLYKDVIRLPNGMTCSRFDIKFANCKHFMYRYGSIINPLVDLLTFYYFVWLVCKKSPGNIFKKLNVTFEDTLDNRIIVLSGKMLETMSDYYVSEIHNINWPKIERIEKKDEYRLTVFESIQKPSIKDKLIKKFVHFLSSKIKKNSSFDIPPDDHWALPPVSHCPFGKLSKCVVRIIGNKKNNVQFMHNILCNPLMSINEFILIILSKGILKKDQICTLESIRNYLI